MTVCMPVTKLTLFKILILTVLCSIKYNLTVIYNLSFLKIWQRERHFSIYQKQNPPMVPKKYLTFKKNIMDGQTNEQTDKQTTTKFF